MIKHHWRYLKYIICHKWFVFIAGLQIGTPLWRLIVHDLSKFRPSEWFAYVAFFYGPKGNNVEQFHRAQDFDAAWLHHQHRNKHHWQYWVLREDDGGTKIMQMPDKYLYEMVADWAGAGRAITGRWEVAKWYQDNKDKIQLHENTRPQVERLLQRYT